MRKLFVRSLVMLLHCVPVFSFGQDTTVGVDTSFLVQTTEDNALDSAFSILGPAGAVSVRTVPQQRVDSFLSEDDFWYANTAPQKKEKEAETKSQTGTSLLQRAWFRQMLWIVILSSFVAIVLWYFYSSNFLVFRKRSKTIAVEEGEEFTEDIFALNYETEIAKAVSANNFRSAVRLWYLQTLKTLSEKGLIDYRFGRTNREYVSQLYNTNYYQLFNRLTRIYEYTWYGQFDLSQPTYNMMQTDFQNFKKVLGQ